MFLSCGKVNRVYVAAVFATAVIINTIFTSVLGLCMGSGQTLELTDGVLIRLIDDSLHARFTGAYNIGLDVVDHNTLFRQ